MYKLFNYYNSLCAGINTPSVYTFDPYVTAIKELFVSELQQIVYYIEKLKDFKPNMSEYTDKVIEFISVLIVNSDFKKESFFIIIEDLYNNKNNLKQMYVSMCAQLNKIPDVLNDSGENLSNRESILKALNEREKNIDKNYSNITAGKDRRILYEIMINLVLNACNCLIELKKFNVDFENAKNQVLKLLNTTNFPSLSNEELIIVIKNFSMCNYKIMKFLYDNITDKFGPVYERDVLFREKEGGAILVSGSGFHDLEMILRAVKGLNINVYTHNGMISAFQFEKFSKYENLAGHYQKSGGNFSHDFASFPGPIYISGNANSKIDAIRGQIYTSSKYPAFGIAKIENKDFSPLIQYALKSKGFAKNTDIKKIKIGSDEIEIKKNVKVIANAINNHEINRLYIIGMSDMFNSSDDYIYQFFKEAPENDFIISFSYPSGRKNFLHANSYYDFALLYKITEWLFEEIDNIEEKLYIFITDCGNEIISHIFNLIQLNVKNIFIGACCPNVINPMIIEGLNKLFNIKTITTAAEDLKMIAENV